MRKSNRTDNDSAKMATGKGVIQGYTGVAVVDGKYQIIVEAQAHGTGSEQELLVPVVKAIKGLLAEASIVTADAGYHSEQNLKQLAAMEVEALVADNGMRQRDERFATQDRHKAAPDPLYDKSKSEKKATTYQPRDFTYDAESKTCVCPAGRSLYSHGGGVINGYAVVRFQGAQRDCVPCAHRQHCLRTPEKTKTRQVAFFRGKVGTAIENHSARMKQRIDSPAGRIRYGERFATVEPVFGNIRYNKGLDRFTLRGKTKVDAQWKLFCLVHNIEKLAHHGYAQ
jgi:IS5 family transposase